MLFSGLVLPIAAMAAGLPSSWSPATSPSPQPQASGTSTPAPKGRTQAQSKPPEPRVHRGLYLEASGFSSYVGTTNYSGSSGPLLLQFGGEMGAGLWAWNMLFFGASTDYRFVNQYSDTSTLNGNRGGTRWSIVNPMVGIASDEWIFKGEFEALGAYNLTAATSLGDKMTYASPLGCRFTGLYELRKHFYGGLHVEYVGFRHVALDGTNLSSGGPVTWDAGLTISWIR